MKYLIRLGIFGFVILSLLAYSQFDKNTNYKPVNARVVKVEELCHMKKVERGIGSKTEYSTKEGDCDIAEVLHKSDPRFEGFDLIRKTYVEYYYVSPADGQAHTGRHRQAQHEDGRKIAAGDELLILAHKKNAEKTRQP